MKALSILQPWAWAIVNGYKPVENRTWRTSFRGRFLVHAGKGFDTEGYHWLRTNREALGLPELPAMPRGRRGHGFNYPGGFQFGGYVGEAELVNCVDHMRSPWFFGPFGFVLINAKPLPFKPARGYLSFFEVEP